MGEMEEHTQRASKCRFRRDDHCAGPFPFLRWFQTVRFAQRGWQGAKVRERGGGWGVAEGRPLLRRAGKQVWIGRVGGSTGRTCGRALTRMRGAVRAEGATQPAGRPARRNRRREREREKDNIKGEDGGGAERQQKELWQKRRERVRRRKAGEQRAGWQHSKVGAHVGKTRGRAETDEDDWNGALGRWVWKKRWQRSREHRHCEEQERERERSGRDESEDGG